MIHYPQDAHFNARFAAHASLCAAGSGRFWEVHDTLFATLSRWDRDPDPQAYFDSLQVALGVPEGVVRDCRDRQRYLRLLSTDIERARASGVRELPALFVGERLLAGAERNVAGIERAVRTALEARR
jgi:protein-disulfide isomerase